MFQPDLLICRDGAPVVSPAQWPARRRELLDILEKEQYGVRPPFSGSAQGKVCGVDARCCAGHARHESLEIAFGTPGGTFTFPMELILPCGDLPRPLILFMNFHPEIYNPYCPVEEIVDNGFALGYLCHTHITTDDGDMTQGLAGYYPRTDPAADWGKLSMWAFAASRALDYLATRPEIDPENVAVLGHSRLGKAALLCGAYDGRFRFVFSNESGCGGAALEQAKHAGAETYADMAKNFPYWFCGNRNRYAADQSAMPYDQHFLLAAIAPRYVAVGSAEEDLWADPYAQQLCCLAASPAWRLHGQQGFIGPEAEAKAPAAFAEGSVGYFLRDGVHYLNRQDWLAYMAFMKRRLSVPRRKEEGRA